MKGRTRREFSWEEMNGKKLARMKMSTQNNK